MARLSTFSSVLKIAQVGLIVKTWQQLIQLEFQRCARNIQKIFPKPHVHMLRPGEKQPFDQMFNDNTNNFYTHYITTNNNYNCIPVNCLFILWTVRSFLLHNL